MLEIAGVDLAILLPFILVGFVAQLIDGALGMAFGVISSTLLISVGVPPAAASAGVHTVESFTTAASGISHAVHRNIDWHLFSRLVIPGMIGGAIGAYGLAMLTKADAEFVKPFVLGYLTLIGFYLLWRALGHKDEVRDPRVIAPLGLVGGFLDAAGGGGWGPVVTSNLLVQGGDPRKVIGTVNTAEFFLAVTVSLTFLFSLGLEAFTRATVGLLIGGVLAAPLGAMVAKRVRAKSLLLLVSAVLILTSLYGLYRALA